MIIDSFEPRTLANMEVALERACSRLAEGSEQHEFRSHIASSILACAQRRRYYTWSFNVCGYGNSYTAFQLPS